MLKRVGDKTTQTEGDPAGTRATSPASSNPSGDDARGKDWFVVENIRLRKQIKSLKGEYEKENRNLSIRCQLLQNRQQIIPSDNFYLQLDKILRRKRKGRKYKNNATQTDITFVSPFFANWESYFEDSAVDRIASDGEVEALKRKRIEKGVSQIRYQYTCSNEVRTPSAKRSSNLSANQSANLSVNLSANQSANQSSNLSANQSANRTVQQRRYPPCCTPHPVPPTRPSTNIFKVPNHVIHKDNILYSLYTDNDLIFIREIAEDLIPKGGEKRDAGGTGNNKGTDRPSPVGSSHQTGDTERRLSERKDVQNKFSWIGNPAEGEKLDDVLTHMNGEKKPQVEENNGAFVGSPDEKKTNETTLRDGGQTPKGRNTEDEMDAVKRDTSDAPSSGAILPHVENKHGKTRSGSRRGKGTKEHPAETDQIIAKTEKYIDVLLKHERGCTSPESSGTTLTPQEHTPHARASHSKRSPERRQVPTCEESPPSEEPTQSATYSSSRRKKKEAPASWQMGVAKRAPICLERSTTTKSEYPGDNATAPLCDNNPPFARTNRKKKKKKKNRPSKQIRLCASSPLTSQMATRMEPSEWNSNPLRGQAQRTSDDTPWVGKTSYPFVKSEADSYIGQGTTCPPDGGASKKGLIPLLWDAEHEGTTPPPLEGCHHSITLSDAERSANEIRKISLEHKKRAFLFYM
ncbi:hypothetical protein C922_03442 [Plasmodium inui San Antonio 1]|uniref:Uncharacterized protein n=1 Tax=Plasmodium inui San Antonio 1 TaxID=1237626 RepID=W6ZZC0_9APIC|nr:hypothetical protein C922_03442 [Plasmodium inui San Antonio 1]EUD66247.1 hypothetical protein C922_03442 [Plasmodium inui San Antonio 1]